MTGLPATGETIHVRLQWRATGRWFTKDYEFTAANLPLPALLAPAGDAPSTSHALLRWTGNGHAVTHWRAKIGSRRGQGNWFDSGNLPGTANEVLAEGLPASGQPLHLRLMWRLRGKWHVLDRQLTAASLPGE